MNKRSTEEWRDLFAEQAHSGLSAAEFCRTRGVCPKYFSKRRKLLSEDAVQASARATPSAFVPVVREGVPGHAPVSRATTIALQVGTAVTLHLPASVSPAWLASLLQSLRA